MPHCHVCDSFGSCASRHSCSGVGHLHLVCVGGTSYARPLPGHSLALHGRVLTAPHFKCKLLADRRLRIVRGAVQGPNMKRYFWCVGLPSPCGQGLYCRVCVCVACRGLLGPSSPATVTMSLRQYKEKEEVPQSHITVCSSPSQGPVPPILTPPPSPPPPPSTLDAPPPSPAPVACTLRRGAGRAVSPQRDDGQGEGVKVPLRAQSWMWTRRQRRACSTRCPPKCARTSVPTGTEGSH